jgi:hypothetical protein
MKHNIYIAFKRKNTIAKHILCTNNNNDKDVYEKSGIYKLKCGSCPGSYAWQMGRSFKIRYKEHINYIGYNGENQVLRTFSTQDMKEQLTSIP